MTKRLILVSFVAVAFLAGAFIVYSQDVPKTTDKKAIELTTDKACCGQADQAKADAHKACGKDGKCANHVEGEKECACKAASAAMDSTACKAMKAESACAGMDSTACKAMKAEGKVSEAGGCCKKK
jgi:hypothetical protein